MLALVACIILVVGIFLSRSVYHFITPNAIDRDAYAHMLYSAHIRDAGHRLPEYPRDTALSGKYTYPFFMHWALSFFPPDTYETIDSYFSPIIDVFFALILLSLVALNYVSLPDSVFVLALFLTTPQFVRGDLPNAIGMSGRKPGLVVTTASLLSISLFASTGALVYALVGILLGCIVFLTSKFSIQAFTFVCLAFGVMSNPLIALLPIAAVVAAIGVTGGTYYRVFSGHLDFLYEYATVKQHKLFSAPQLNPVDILEEIDGFEDILRFGFNNRVIRPVVNNPFFVALAFTYAYAMLRGTSVPINRELEVWLLGSVAAFVLTSLPYLLFLGKAERYLEYGFVPAAVLLVNAWNEFGLEYQVPVAAILASGAVVILFYYVVYERFFFSSADETEAEELTAFLKTLDDGTVIVQPMWESRRIAWETNHEVVDFLMNEGGTPNEELDRLCPDRYAFVTNDTSWLANMYAPDFAVFDKEEYTSLNDSDFAPPDIEPLFENSRFSVYRFDEAS